MRENCLIRWHSMREDSKGGENGQVSLRRSNRSVVVVAGMYVDGPQRLVHIAAPALDWAPG